MKLWIPFQSLTLQKRKEKKRREEKKKERERLKMEMHSAEQRLNYRSAEKNFLRDCIERINNNNKKNEKEKYRQLITGKTETHKDGDRGRSRGDPGK